jgi:hypothetical protein
LSDIEAWGLQTASVELWELQRLRDRLH